ncbi:N-carbamoyl-L-amino acid hydrolase [Serratia liquefaciens]|nr:N-carbamoyl-L-amino acid hydrolase [Serratia liquefaciens]
MSVAQALVNAGLDPARIAHAARHPRDIAAYLELHIEQGGRAWSRRGWRSAWWRRLTAPDG